VSVAVSFGFRVSGKFAPLAVKPVPESDVESIVTAAFPVADSVSVCVAALLTATSPKLMLLALTFRVEIQELSCNVVASVTPPALAVNVADSFEVTGEAFAMKFALLAPAATITEPGTLTNELLLARVTANPPLRAAAFNVTVQLSASEPVIVELAQVMPLSTGTPVPLSPTTVELPLEELLARESCPAAAPEAVGSNCTLTTSVWPGARVTGRLAPEIEKPVPDSDAALTVTGMVPVEERTTGCDAGEFTGTLPNATLEVLMPRICEAASS
jgi:hypothetical protein